MSLDFSTKADLQPLARVVADLDEAAAALGVEYFLIGATARDMRLRHQYGVDRLRATEDVDFAAAVANWQAFGQLREALILGKQFLPRPGPQTHRLRHVAGSPLDIVPFGGVEQGDRTIAWPPDRSETFDCFGLAEALDTCEWVQLPMGAKVRVPSIPALALLKLTAWRDRQEAHRGKDAPDFLQYLRHYMDCGNVDRVVSDHADLYDRTNYDHDEAGARLLARDIVKLIDAETRKRLVALLANETDEEGPLKMAHQSGMDLERARRLIEAFVEKMVA